MAFGRKGKGAKAAAGRGGAARRGRVEHPSYGGVTAERGWVATERERTERDVRRRFAYIIAFSVAILAVVVLGVIAAARSSAASGAGSVTAADTYAISEVTRARMEGEARDFATALLASTYTSDKEAADAMRRYALSMMAVDTQSYRDVQSLPVGEGRIPKDDLRIDVTDLRMVDGSQAYAGTYVYRLHAQAADSAKSAYVDPGYDVTVAFNRAEGPDGKSTWAITSASVSRSTLASVTPDNVAADGGGQPDASLGGSDEG